MIPLTLLPHQHEAVMATEPYVALVTGVGGGKTWIGARWIIGRALEFPRSLHLATSNSIRQAHDVVARELVKACEQHGIPYRWRKVDGVIEVAGNRGVGEIRVRSTDPTSVDKLRGPEYGSWWGDEVRDAPSYAVEVVIPGRLRCRHVDRPRYLWTTTPNGFDHIYRRHREEQHPDRRLVDGVPSDANPYLTREYLEGILGSYDVDLVKQERGGQFVIVGTGRVYRAFDRNLHVTERAEHDPNLPLRVAFDFNIGHMALVVIQAKGHREAHAIDEFCGGDIYDAPREFAAKYKPINRSGLVYVHGDPSGNGRDSEGFTDYVRVLEVLRPAWGEGVVMAVATVSPRQVDRVNTTNALMRNAKGETRYFVHPRCKRLIRDYESVVWNKDGTSILKPDPQDRRTRLTDFSDAVDYYLFVDHRPEAFRHEPTYVPSSRRAG